MYWSRSSPHGNKIDLLLVPTFICTHEEHTVPIRTQNSSSRAFRIAQMQSLSGKLIGKNKQSCMVPSRCHVCGFGLTWTNLAQNANPEGDMKSKGLESGANPKCCPYSTSQARALRFAFRASENTLATPANSSRYSKSSGAVTGHC